MILFPAIDILDGRAVRLLYGKRNEVTDYGTPLERARMWVDAGAEYLHVVDLSGAFDGRSNIDETIYQISKLGVPIQSGGGLRSMEDVANRLSAGAERVVLGTLWMTDPELAMSLVKKYGDKIVAGIDGKNGKLAVKGWTEECDLTVETVGKRAHQMGVRYAVYTDISKDGALTGVALQDTVQLSKATGLHVIASGGIRSMEDLYRIRDSHLYGAILGRSIYEGTISLRDAIREMGHAV